MQIHVGRRGDRRIGEAIDVAGDVDGLRGQHRCGGRAGGERQGDGAAPGAGRGVVHPGNDVDLIRPTGRQVAERAAGVSVAGRAGHAGGQHVRTDIADAERGLVVRRTVDMDIRQHDRGRSADHRLRQQRVGQHGAGCDDGLGGQALGEAGGV